jgi:hypothetical protein
VWRTYAASGHAHLEGGRSAGILVTWAPILAVVGSMDTFFFVAGGFKDGRTFVDQSFR